MNNRLLPRFLGTSALPTGQQPFVKCVGPTLLPSVLPATDPLAVWVEGDYHLMSQAGRWDPISGTWVKDLLTSPCLDSGAPESPTGSEPVPNGGRINMGVYGGTSQASKSANGN